MNDISCFSIYKKRCKKGRKYKEWKIDAIRDADVNQIQFLEKQLQRMRKKEENPVGRKTVAKRNTQGTSNNNHISGNTYGVAPGDQPNSAAGANAAQFGGRPSTSGQNAGLGVAGPAIVGPNG